MDCVSTSPAASPPSPSTTSGPRLPRQAGPPLGGWCSSLLSTQWLTPPCLSTQMSFPQSPRQPKSITPLPAILPATPNDSSSCWPGSSCFHLPVYSLHIIYPNLQYFIGEFLYPMSFLSRNKMGFLGTGNPFNCSSLCHQSLEQGPAWSICEHFLSE